MQLTTDSDLFLPSLYRFTKTRPLAFRPAFHPGAVMSTSTHSSPSSDSTHFDTKLTPIQADAAIAFGFGLNFAAVAAQFNIHRSTIHNWMKNPAFVEAAQSCQAEFEKQFRTQLTTLTRLALDNLRQIPTDPDASPFIRQSLPRRPETGLEASAIDRIRHDFRTTGVSAKRNAPSPADRSGTGPERGPVWGQSLVRLLSIRGVSSPAYRRTNGKTSVVERICWMLGQGEACEHRDLHQRPTPPNPDLRAICGVSRRFGENSLGNSACPQTDLNRPNRPWGNRTQCVITLVFSRGIGTETKRCVLSVPRRGTSREEDRAL